ncbi:hypothetical protein VTK26DRAFT_204 [Humicola hyalothermophila]
MDSSDTVSTLILAVLCFIFPPLGVGLMAGCGPDLLMSILLTFFLWLPAILHAFYLLYVYYDRREKVKSGVLLTERAPFVFSEKIQTGGRVRL